METSMYDTLLQLPLFQGLCKEDFTLILERVKFHFLNYNPQETITRQGDPCNQLIFLLSGEVSLKAEDEAQVYTLVETLDEPCIIEPFSLFGMNTTYTATYQAQTEAKLLTIDKAYIYSELNNYEIFRLNYLNLLSNRIQVAHQKLWNNRMGTLNEKLWNFLYSRCQRPQGEKVLQITMENLARLINETRINVSRALNKLQEEGAIQLRRKAIYIPAIEKLPESLI